MKKPIGMVQYQSMGRSHAFRRWTLGRQLIETDKKAKAIFRQAESRGQCRVK